MTDVTVTVVADDGKTGTAVITLQDPVVKPSPIPLVRPPVGGYFPLTASGDFPVGVGKFDELPDDRVAGGMVFRSVWEPRPSNESANMILPPPGWKAPSPTDKTNPYPKKVWDRVTGACPLATPTTDELIQWAAAKWGLADDLIRAQMVQESWWYQDLKWSDDMPVSILNRFGILGRPTSCPLGTPVYACGYGDYAPGAIKPDGTPSNSHGSPNTMPGVEYNKSLGGTLIDNQFKGSRVNGPESFGISQCRWFANTDLGPTGFGCYPYTELSTATALDVCCATIRAEYEGWNSWKHGGYDAYRADPGGSIGVWGAHINWYSAGWYSAKGQQYMDNVKDFLAKQPWLDPAF